MVAASAASLVSVSVTGSAVYPTTQQLVPSPGHMQLISTNSPAEAFFRRTYVASSHYFITETMEMSLVPGSRYIVFGIELYCVSTGLGLPVGTAIGADAYFFSRVSAGRVLLNLQEMTTARLLRVGYDAPFGAGDLSLSVGNVDSGGAVDSSGSPHVFCDAAPETFRFPIVGSHLAWYDYPADLVPQRKFRVSYQIAGQPPLALKAG